MLLKDMLKVDNKSRISLTDAIPILDRLKARVAVAGIFGGRESDDAGLGLSWLSEGS